MAGAASRKARAAAGVTPRRISEPAIGTEPHSQPGSTTPAQLATGTPATSFSVPNVPPGTYWVRVRGSNDAGTGAPSQDIAIVMGTTSGCSSLPGSPVLLTPVTDGRNVTLSWNTPAFGGRVLQYVLLFPLLLLAYRWSLRIGWRSWSTKVPLQILIGFVFALLARPALILGEFLLHADKLPEQGESHADADAWFWVWALFEDFSTLGVAITGDFFLRYGFGLALVTGAALYMQYRDAQLRAEALERFPEKGDHESSTFPELAEEGRLRAFRHTGLWLTVNTPKELRRADEHVSANPEWLG